MSTVTLYTAGATQPSPESFNSLRGVGRPFVNGQQQQSNNFTLDGVDTNEAINNGIAYQPSPDAVEQVSVETLNYSAELGNVAGAVVNMVIKSGTNQFRGNAFEYWRDNRLAATPWNTNRLGGKKSKWSSTATRRASRFRARRPGSVRGGRTIISTSCTSVPTTS